jgi:hypothetical protein
MGKMKNFKFGNTPYDAEDFDDWEDDDYHYRKWKRKQKKPRADEYGDDHIDYVDE